MIANLKPFDLFSYFITYLSHILDTGSVSC